MINVSLDEVVDQGKLQEVDSVEEWFSWVDGSTDGESSEGEG